MECNSEKLGEIPEMEDLWIVQRGVHFLGIFEKKKREKLHWNIFYWKVRIDFLTKKQVEP